MRQRDRTWSIGEPNRKGRLYARHGSDAFRLAEAICGAGDDAERTVLLAFSRSFARFDHLRGDDVFESALLSEIVDVGHRRAGGSRTAVQQRAFAALLALGFSPPAATDVIGLSGSKAAHLSESLQEEPGEAVPAAKEPPPDLLRRAQRRAGSRLVTTALVIGSLVAAAVFVRPGTPPERAGSATETSLPAVLPGGLRPVGIKVPVARGAVSDFPFVVSAYPAKERNVCMELRVDETFGTVHCLTTFTEPFRTFISPDRRHDATFIYGYARGDVTDMTVSEPGGAPLRVDIATAPEELTVKEPRRYFAITLPSYLLGLSSKKEGRLRGYRVFELRLSATKGGRSLASERIFLGRPER